MASQASKSVLLEERVAIGKAPPGGRVDRKAKLIRGVKILGFHSRNPGSVLGEDFADMAGYDYDPSAIKQALPLYEGAPVNLDHLESKRDRSGMRVPDGSRHVKERFGRLQNVRVESDGAYADIRYLDNHPLTPMVLEAAEELPDVFTMSHHAHGEVDKGDDGRGKVTKINQVHSVDLIAERPGTTTSLFESSPMDDDSATTNTGSAATRRSARDGDGEPRDSFCHDVMAACQNEDLDLAGTVFQVLQAIVKSANCSANDNTDDATDDSETDDASVTEDDVAETEESADDDGGDSPMQESLRRSPRTAALRKRIRLLESRERACILLSERGLTLTPELITAVAAQGNHQAQQALIESLATSPERPAQKPVISRPRSASPFSLSSARSGRLGQADATQDLLLSLGRARLK